MRFPHYQLSAYQARNNPLARARLGAATLELRRVDALLDLASPTQRAEWESLTLSYAPERGSPALRESIAAHYPSLTAEHIVVFSSATEALFCLLHAATEPGNRCTVVTPCYEPLAKIPESIGATVSCVPLQRSTVNDEDSWQLDDEALRAVAGESELVCINFPHNPTGAMISQPQLNSLVAACDNSGARLLSDEVFRGLEHDAATQLIPAACLSPRGISIGSIAKPHGVGGIRIGWAASQDTALLERAVEIRRTLSVCSGTTDEWLARLVLEHSEKLRDDSLATLTAHLRLIEDTLPEMGERLIWTAPAAGCAAFPLLCDFSGTRIESAQLAQRCLEETGVMLIPARCFVGGEDEKFSAGFRLGYGLADFPEVWTRFVRFITQSN